jgi:hypothetical protein
MAEQRVRRWAQGFRPGVQHPEQQRRDLNPEASPSEQPPRSAYDMKDMHERLPDLQDDDLKQIPVLPSGSRLKQGSTYVDLGGERREFKATADMVAGPNNRYVPKAEVDHELWNRLIGVDNPTRLGRADED